jgi:leader peptidase (prepilin peptidase)/N-methyltransferase
MTAAMVQRSVQTNIYVILSALGAVAISLTVAPGLNGAVGAALAVVMISIAVADARAYIIPDPLIVAGIALAMVHVLISSSYPPIDALVFAAARGLLLALLFYALRVGYRRLRGRHGLGLGDVKLAGIAGAMLDWIAIPIVIEIAALSALGYYGFQYFFRKQPVHAYTRLPFGLFLAPAIWSGWLLQASILAPN